VIFHIDSNDDGLCSKDEIRPDYLVFYSSPKMCIATIIELKGCESKSQEHGVRQIVAFKKKLRAAIAAHLPRKMKVNIQGILLTPYNSQVPLKLILREQESGFNICSVQCGQKAELYRYVTQLISPRTKEDPKEKLPYEKEEFNWIEKVIVGKADVKKFNPTFFNSVRYSEADSVYASYDIGGIHVSLFTDNSNAKINVGKKDTALIDKLKGELGAFDFSKHFEFSKSED